MKVYINAFISQKTVVRMTLSLYCYRNFYKRTAYIRDLEQPGIMKTYIQGQLRHESKELNIKYYQVLFEIKMLYKSI